MIFDTQQLYTDLMNLAPVRLIALCTPNALTVHAWPSPAPHQASIWKALPPPTASLGTRSSLKLLSGPLPMSTILLEVTLYKIT